MPRVIVDGQQERGIFHKGKHYHFDHEGLCTMDRAEFDILHALYRFLVIIQEIPAIVKTPEPELKPEKEIEVEIKVKKEVKPKKPATRKKVK